MYHAGSNMIRDNSKLVVKDIMKEFNALRPIYWRNSSKHMSIELMIQRREKTKRNENFLFSEDIYFSFYNEKTHREHGNIHAQTFALYRSYIRDMNTILNSNNNIEIDNAKEGLIRKIESQDFKQNKIAILPRTNIVSGSYLINEIKKGNLPEDDITNYFSLW